ncbi:MAG TPA: LamG-like jellyroll fold domain-containing protein [Candidatus Nanoarchaeia archaeon]|nr:LamG-like jellyroll fold domain-containing protein [Candidatus Nanoarchaeia archaeon]
MTRSTNPKAQSSLEFMILAGVMLFFFLAFFAAMSDQMLGLYRAREDKRVNDLILSVRDEIELARAAQSGYERAFSLPATLEGRNYSIRFYGDEKFIVRFSDRFYEQPSPPNVQGDLFKGKNVIAKRGNLIMLNSVDPCVDPENQIYEGNKSFCIANDCWCLTGMYQILCDEEDDNFIGECSELPLPDPSLVETAVSELQKGNPNADSGKFSALDPQLLPGAQYMCSSFDYCNEPPEFTSGPEFVSATDSAATFSFTASEDVRANVYYSTSQELLESSPQVFASSVSGKTQYVTINMLASETNYFAKITIYDRKRANTTAPSISAPLQFTTTTDVSPPAINWVRVSPETGTRDTEFTITANITEYTQPSSAIVTAKIVRPDGSEVFELPLAYDAAASAPSAIPPSYIFSVKRVPGHDLDPKASYDAGTSLFYASYDSGVNADYAGSTAAQQRSSIALAGLSEGRFMDALELGQGQGVNYPSQGNLDITKGSVEFWFSPRWTSNPSSTEKHAIFEAYDNNDKDWLVILEQGEDLIFNIVRDAGVAGQETVFTAMRQGTRVTSAEPDPMFEEDGWYFMTATWDSTTPNLDDRMELFMNADTEDNYYSGNLADLSGLSLSSNGIISVGYSKFQGIGDVEGKIDQLRIFNTPLTQSQILSDYRTSRTYSIDTTAKDTRIDTPPSTLEGKGTFTVNYG